MRIRRLQGSTICRWMELSLRYNRSRVLAMFYQQPNCKARKPFPNEMAFWWYFEAKLNDSDVKFKIHYKYGNARFEKKSGLPLWVTLHSQRLDLQGTVLMNFETILKHAERSGQTWTDYVFGIFFPSLALIHPRVMDWQQIFKNANYPAHLWRHQLKTLNVNISRTIKDFGKKIHRYSSFSKVYPLRQHHFFVS